jgi:serine/threonine protein phosphatase PrpC
MAALRLESTARTDPGRVRTHNEDAVFASPRLAAVADGVGGQAAGEVASGTVIDALAALDKRWLDGRLDEALSTAIAGGNENIRVIGEVSPPTAGMATTLTAVALDDDGAYLVANVGDSRTYLRRDGELRQLTRDDSWVQQLVDTGALSEEEARSHPQRNVVVVTLDGAPGRAPELARLAARAGDRLLLCSDGVSDLVTDDEIAAALTLPDRGAAADRLIELANAAGGKDNISAIVADVVEGQDPDAGWRRAGAGAPAGRA